MIHLFTFIAKFSLKAGIGGEGKRSRNSDRKRKLALLGKHEQIEGVSSTKRNLTSGFPALEGCGAERGVKVVCNFPRSCEWKV